MPQKISFIAQPRSITGKKVKVLRTQSLIPANITGNVEHSIPVAMDKVKFSHLYHQVGDTGLFYITVEGEKQDRPVLVTEVQYDPITARIEHVVLRQVNLTEKLTAEVPVVVVGELQVKNAIAALLHDSIEVKALPQDLPEKFEIDISEFTEFGQMVTFAQLKFDRSKVELEVEADQMDTPVLMIQEVKEEVEPVVEAAAPVEGEASAATPGAEPAAEGAAKTEEKKA